MSRRRPKAKAALKVNAESEHESEEALKANAERSMSRRKPKAKAALKANAEADIAEA